MNALLRVTDVDVFDGTVKEYLEEDYTPEEAALEYARDYLDALGDDAPRRCRLRVMGTSVNVILTVTRTGDDLEVARC